MYFDSHAHYDDERFEEDRAVLLQQLPLDGISYVVNAAASMESAYTSVQLANEYKYIYATVGVHPHEVESMKEGDIQILKKLAQNQKVVAIGEIGLDYYYDFSPRELQRIWFKRQLELAKELDLPVVIHSREACQETFDTLMLSGVKTGVIHCFSGSKELAREYVKKGFYIGIGGAVTFKNARKTVEVVEAIPLERILIETDCPYLTPVPHRGKRNDSSYLGHVVDKIAEIKNISALEVARVTEENAKKLFKIT
ncbi:MAG: TatD family hydrolase [Cellulosilyticaceae bacterium]